MSVCASSSIGPKIRLNITATTGDDSTVGKFLICIDEDALVEDLVNKVRSALSRSRIEGHVARLTNHCHALLPIEERVGDALRDGEEVLAVLSEEDPARSGQRLIQEPTAFKTPLPPLVTSESRGFPSSASRPSSKSTPCPSEAFQDLGEGARWFTHEPLREAPHSAMKQHPVHLPGPSEVFEPVMPQKLLLGAPRSSRGPSEDFGEALAAGPGPVETLVQDHRLDPRARTDWEVESLTPKLREYVITRFREIQMTIADPGQTFLTISMRPRERLGAVAMPAPVHYSLARIDVIEFERLCGRKIKECRRRLEYFQRSREALMKLLDRGASKEDYVPNMLPYRFRADEEIGHLLSEVEEPVFAQAEAFRPIIVVDTSGALGEYWPFIKAAMKRMLYSFLVDKSRFNIIGFNQQGQPIAFETGLVPPTAQKLREAEDFFEQLKPVRSADLLEGLRKALVPSEGDTVFVLTSGLGRRIDANYVLNDLRGRNIREMSIHVIGVDCEAKVEVDLRRLAEENHGTFRQKRFEALLNASTQVNVTDVPGLRRTAGKGEDRRLTAGGQVELLEVMISEQEMQVNDWLEEQTCANRLMLTSASQMPVPEPEQANLATKRVVLNQLCRAPQPWLKDMLQGTVQPHPGPPPNAVRVKSPAEATCRVGPKTRKIGPRQ